MTVVDFRSGGFDGSHRGAGVYSDHDYAPGHAGHGHVDLDWTEDHDWDNERFATDDGATALTERDTIVGRVARLTHYLGAVISVLLMVSLAVWGYRLVVRDVSGVPVIRAVQGDSRTAPDEPGGQLSERSGLAVNQIAAGTEQRRVSEVAIAPGPVSLTADDVAMGKLGATARPTALTEEIPADPNARDVVAMSDADAARAAQAAADAALESAEAGAADMVATDVAVLSNAPAAEAPVNEAVTDLAGERAQGTAITEALAEAGAEAAPGALAASPRPAPRPRRTAIAAAAAVAAPEAAAATAPAEAPASELNAEPAAEPAAAVKSASVASGAALVQIGAFDSDAIAGAEWDRVSGRYSSLFAGKSPVVQKHEAGGRTFWRLRVAGFAGRDDARKFCAALIEAGGDCIPAVAK
ncbi:SPOR domain-containing protein [Paracoccus marinus]|uniref:SPOR domain-containing protein n=1 Tax=Paracoccus marinus TaxID=288426 RepID=UPI00117FB01A|nr:SPOR domain-containing protein [Paracoccus marinus]